MPSPRLGIKLLPRVPVRLAGAGDGGPVSAGGLLARVAPAHRLRALALARGADMRSAFALLLGGTSSRFLALGAPQVAAVTAGAVVFRGPGFPQGDGNGLPAALDLAAPATAPTLQLAVLELMHDPAADPFLSG